MSNVTKTQKKDRRDHTFGVVGSGSRFFDLFFFGFFLNFFALCETKTKNQLAIYWRRTECTQKFKNEPENKR